MPQAFTFVPVQASKTSRCEAVTATDRVKIRSAAASNPRKRGGRNVALQKPKDVRRSRPAVTSVNLQARPSCKAATAQPFGSLNDTSLENLLFE